MKRFTSSFAVKSIAVFLFVIFTISAVLFGALIFVMAEGGFYTSDIHIIKDNMLNSYLRSDTSNALNMYFRYNIDQPEREFQYTNFLFVIKNSEGKTLCTNYNGENYEYSQLLFYDGEIIYFDKIPEESADPNSYYIAEGFINSALDKNDKYSISLFWIETGHNWRYAAIAIFVFSSILLLADFIFLLYSAGRKYDEKNLETIISPNVLDKIPFDVYICICIGIVVAVMFVISEVLYYFNSIVEFALIGICAVILLVVFIAFFMTLSTRLKLGKWWVNTLIFRILQIIWKILVFLLRKILYLIRCVPVAWKLILSLCLLFFFEFLFLISRTSNPMFWFVSRILILIAVILICANIKKLIRGTEIIASGDTTYRIDTKNMFFSFKKQAENLNNIGKGMTLSLNEMMKSERLKTELITNVSHDIKTPLTSIINYIGLLQKESIPSDEGRKYVDVLEKQSSRLKKLIEDLIEASKASTGNIEINPMPCETGVLLAQISGEYSEKLSSKNLELIIDKPDTEIIINADGRLLWRIFDNLLGNIYKYAQPSTRVYITLEKKGNIVSISFKNISLKPLNIPPEELTGRFVRGDSSRNTEGSGLGLSIAKNLVELQGGKMDIIIDGDLFKAVLIFKTEP